ncbi:MAG TPA: ABC transporter substrate-binding protein [Bacillales bacterium]|nr:ABC transporter substrate-binding protein [Bacillales bacterium]
MKGSHLFFAVLFVAIFSLLSACSSSQSSSSSTDDSEKTLVVGRGGDSVSLDPALPTDGESFKVVRDIFETLVNFNYEKQNTELVNTGLAKKWEISDDGKTYTFYLRKGIQFQDGTDFNAKAVVFNFKRWADPKNKGKIDYYPILFGGFKKDDIIKSVEATGKYTVKVTLNHPYAPFLKQLEMPPFSIVSPTALKKWGEDFGKHPVGTGPFKFVKWKPNNIIVLEKNDDYWKKGLPKLNRVIFKVIKSNRARLTALENGEIDLMTGLDPNDINEVKNKKGIKVYYRPPLNVGYLGMTVTRKPFDNRKVRLAMNYAINKKALVKAFFSDKAKVAVSPLPPTVFGFNSKLDPYQYNPKKAKKLLAEAGYPNGFKMDLWAMPVPRPYMPNGEKIAQALQADLAKVGIKAKIVTYDWATYLQKIAQGKADTCLLGWTGGTGGPDAFLTNMFSSSSIGGNNSSRYSNPKVDQLLKKARRAGNKEKRKQLYEKIQLLIHKDAPWVPLVHSTPPLAGRADLAGFKPQPTGLSALSRVYFQH